MSSQSSNQAKSKGSSKGGTTGVLTKLHLQRLAADIEAAGGRFRVDLRKDIYNVSEDDTYDP